MSLLGRASVVGTSLVLVLGVAACGSDDDTNKAAGGTTQTTATSDTAAAKATTPADDSVAKAPQQPSTSPAAKDPNGNYLRTALGVNARPPRTEADRAVLAMRSIYAGLRVNGDVSHVCDLMTPAARRAMAKSGPDKGMTCKESLLKYHAFAERDDPSYRRSLKAKVLGAKVNGNRAVVQVKFPGRRAVRDVELVKIDGQWRLGAPLG